MFPRQSDYLTWTKNNTILKSIATTLDNWIRESKDASILEAFSEDLLINKISLVMLQKKYSPKLSYIAAIYQNPKEIDKHLDDFMIIRLRVEIRQLLEKYTKENCKCTALSMP